jgi:hypothetical protein
MTILVLLVAMVGMTIFGAIETVHESRGLRSRRASRSWPKTTGTILKWDYTDSFGGGGSRFHHDLSCLYKYTVNGTEFTNDRITFFALSDGNINNIGDDYKAGSTCQVFYDPANPKNSVLMRGWSSGMMVFGIVFFLVPLVFFVRMWIDRDAIIRQWEDWPWFSFPPSD